MLPQIITMGIQLIVSLIVGIIQAIPQLLGMIPTIFMAFVEGLLSVNWLQVGWDILKSIGMGILNGVKSLGKTIWNGIKSIFGGGSSKAEVELSGAEMMDSYANGVNTSLNTIAATTNATVDTSLSQGLTADLSGAGTATMSTYNTGLTTGLASVEGLTTGIGTDITADFDLDLIAQGAGTMDTFTTGLTTGGEGAITASQETADSIQKTFNSVDLTKSGTNIMNGLIAGLNGMRSAVIATAQSIANSVKNTINEALDIHSPSGVAEWQMEMYGAGVERGAEKALPGVREASGSISDSIYRPETTGTRTQHTTTNSYAPQFNLYLYGTTDRTTERTIKKWIRESLEDTFNGLSRSNPRLTEV